MVYRDYCTEIYYQDLDLVGVPADSNLRIANQVYYLEDIREDPIALPPPEQALTTQDPSQGIEIPAGAPKEKNGDMGVSRPEEKAEGKAKEKAKSKANANPPEAPLQLKTWCPRLKLLNPSPRLTPRKILINHRLRYRVLALL